MHTKEELEQINKNLAGETKEKDAIKRSKSLVFKGKVARKGHAFFIVTAVKNKQKYTRLVELGALPSKKHEDVVYEELEAFLLKDMGLSIPSEF